MPTAASVNYNDVLDAYNLCADGDTLTIPAGSATWSTVALAVTKNISIVGAGAGLTIITENLPRVPYQPIFKINLPKELQSPNYSFRLSGMTLRSSNATILASDKAFIELRGISHGTDSPAPYVRGCVSRCRLDHLNLENLNGLNILIDSCLGVADHITHFDTTAPYGAFPIKVFMQNWTPGVNPADGAPLPSTYLATYGFGSWADETYWGTDKWWFFEDCSFSVGTNLCDNEEAARCVFRHCTITGGSPTSHGMEGRRQPGIRAHEVYNNHFIDTVGMAQHRSGTVLYFNNKSTGIPNGISLSGYRVFNLSPNWGGANGENRYDWNDSVSGLLVSGTITAVAAPGGAGAPTITVGVSDDLSDIDLTDGNAYVILDLNDPFTNANNGGAVGEDNDPGWQYFISGIYGIAGKVLTISHFATPPRSAAWAVGHAYEIRRVFRVYGASGQGKGNLINTQDTGGFGSYASWTYPATSGTKATTPCLIGQGGSTPYPLDPCYSWNNTDDTFGYLGFGGTIVNTNIKLGVHAFNLSERTIETQNVGYPAVTYNRATSNWPDIGEDSDIPYTPFTYPHPLTGATVGAVILITGDMDFGNIIIGQTSDSTLTIANTGDELLTVTNITMPTGFTLTGSTSFTVAAGASTNRTVTFTPLLEQLYSDNITVASDNDSGSETKACTGTGVPPAGGGHGKGKKKGVMTRRT